VLAVPSGTDYAAWRRQGGACRGDGDRRRHPARAQRRRHQFAIRAVDPAHAFVNDDHAMLLQLDRVTGGGMVLAKPTDEEQAPTETITWFTVRDGGFLAAIQVSEAGSRHYLDKSWRVR
jgi:hypothetical protein